MRFDDALLFAAVVYGLYATIHGWIRGSRIGGPMSRRCLAVTTFMAAIGACLAVLTIGELFRLMLFG
jgi:hypothetical protein